MAASDGLFLNVTNKIRCLYIHINVCFSNRLSICLKKKQVGSYRYCVYANARFSVNVVDKV